MLAAKAVGTQGKGGAFSCEGKCSVSPRSLSCTSGWCRSARSRPAARSRSRGPYIRGTKEMMQPCTLYPTVISLVQDLPEAIRQLPYVHALHTTCSPCSPCFSHSPCSACTCSALHWSHVPVRRLVVRSRGVRAVRRGSEREEALVDVDVPGDVYHQRDDM